MSPLAAQAIMFGLTLAATWAAVRSLQHAQRERAAAEELVALADHYRQQAERHHDDARACVGEWIA